MLVKRVVGVALLIGLMGCGMGDDEKGMDEMATEHRHVSDFNGISLDGTGHLIIKQGASEMLDIEAPAKVIGWITSGVDGNTLKIETHPEKDTVLSPSLPITYTVIVKDLSKIELAGVGKVTSRGQIQVEDLEIDLSGSGDVNLKIKGDSVKTVIAGMGQVHLRGEVEEQKVVIRGFGQYEASQLVSEDAEVDIQGAGKVTVNATDSLDVEIAGGGGVFYIGSPKISQKISGAGEVSSVKQTQNETAPAKEQEQSKTKKQNGAQTWGRSAQPATQS